MALTSLPAAGTSAPAASATEHLDVLIVGAGLSGIGAAYRLQEARPGATYTILEAREDLGGTWDLFRYPGVRSDSDMYTLGYPFRPWTGGKTLADGPSILDYVRDTAREFGIDRRIRYSSRVVAADFDSAASRWTVTVEDPRSQERRTLTCGFLYACAGYYDYERPHAPEFTGADTFEGRVVHPQFWPDDLDHTGKRVVVIGSGATAVTLVPSLLQGEDAAAHVTMLQRSPTWISPVPQKDAAAEKIRAVLPDRWAHRAVRAKNIAVSTAVYQYCRRRPQSARKVLNRLSTKIVGDAGLVAEHFTPTYDPWDQRLCAVPDGDLFKAVRAGTARVVTDHIDRFVPEGVLLRSGEVLEADVVVTATGLRLLPFGGIRPRVDGREVDLSERYIWQGAMISGVPNFAVCVGYTNASWTLRADLTHRLVCKVLTWMDRERHTAVAPQPDRELTPRPLLDLASGYVRRAADSFPRQGDRSPWLMRQNYALDALTTLRTDLARSLRPLAPATEASDWQPDVLGDGYERRTLELGPDPEGEGQVAAVVVRRAVRPEERTDGAVLYVHGFSDYFFQTELADFFAARGLAFYGLDLRKCGRARRPGQTAHYASDLARYDADLDRALDVVAEDHPGRPVLVVAHSTGGLITPLYLDRRRRAGRPAPVSGLVLNSPWLDLQGKPVMRGPVTWALRALARLRPFRALDLPSSVYGDTLHTSGTGEWDFDLELKPLHGFPVTVGWLNAVRRGHAALHRGLDVGVPTLVLRSDKTHYSAAYSEASDRADTVLDVRQIAQWAGSLGGDTTDTPIPDARHDVFLSLPAVREHAYDRLDAWLRRHRLTGGS
ncbi:alpha/beta fold hydrolase [Streptomyces longispororuber]|uniref:alpha/beta fold hydrolase n=1 Tax=Streptomyces longispororuber TaxID=68230 RepID=UPI00210EC5DC|nr:alpha/beta fold hydrolase [Streptomyces longispororuber]MCQ4206358.1 alpha/beta fold hydrolase [Streptomyces longispororuber]